MSNKLEVVNGLVSDPIHGGVYRVGVRGEVIGMDGSDVGHISPSGEEIVYNPGMHPRDRK